MHNREFLVVDFEFTTFDRPVGRPRAFFSEILECGAVLAQPPDFLPQEKFQTFVQPRFFPKLAGDSQQFAMITQADLDGGMAFEDMVTKLAGFYRSGVTFIAAWGDADWEVLDTACSRYKVINPFRFEDYVDIAKEYRTLYRHERTPSLKFALEEQSLQPDGFLHTALEDARGTAKLITLMLAAGWRPGQPAGTERLA
ncbi:MAG: exonuclease domain-containing protein [Negativicutes bacterium]|nr:exonuclease domain-containing protein [Negativicutes bacterium]